MTRPLHRAAFFALVLAVAAGRGSVASASVSVTGSGSVSVPAAPPPAWADPLLARGFDHREGGLPRPMLVQGVAGTALQGPSQGTPEEIARRLVASRLKPAGELALVSVVEGGGGVRFVTLQQRFAGVPTWLGRIGVAVAPDGSVLAMRTGEIAPAAPEPVRAQPKLADAEAALSQASVLLGLPPDAPRGPQPLAEPVLVATAGGAGAEHAWRVDSCAGGRADRRVQAILRASDGAPLRLDPAIFPGIARARVATHDPTRGFTMQDCAEPVLNASVDSPAGWSFAAETTGNNTFVQLDREGDFWPPYGPHATATGDPLTLDFPYTGDPRADADAALANVFWLVNDAHDRFRRLGFDEASGASQLDNFGRGGRGDDRIWALVQYGSVDGATPYEGVGLGIGADGSFTYIVTGVFEDAAGELRDSAFEADLVYHELAHQLPVRLIGDDPACLNGAQPQALMEGWSDFLAASFTNDPVIGAWTSGIPAGIRTGPIGATALSLVNLCEGGCERFRDGEIWSGLLWDLRSRFVQLHGTAGIAMAERLSVEALRYAPCRPTFLDARDALLLADGALSGGAHRCELWQLSVNRGLGFSATSSGPDDTRPIAGYDMPPECSGREAVAFSQDAYSPDDEGIVEVVDATPQAGASVTITASGGDALTLPLQPVPSGPLLRAGFAIVPGSPDPADAVLQAAAGETIAVAYGTAGDTADVSDGMALSIVEHFVSGNWCQMRADDDYLDGWWILPRFLDPGEEATIAVTMGNGLPDELQDLEVSVTSLSPFVRVLPSVPFRLGTIGAQQGNAPRRFQADFKATAALGTPPGTLADIRMDFRSRGRSGSVTLRLELAMDYVVETGLSPFDGGMETFDAATSSTVGGWSLRTPRGGPNSWRLESCAGRSDAFGWHVGEPGCAEYVDGQVAAALVSPSIFPVPADAVAFRLQDWSFSVDSALYTDPGNPLCEADFVGLFVPPDADAFDYSNPEIIYFGSAQRYWRPLYEDTGGWQTQSPPYYNRNPQPLIPGADYSGLRFLWAFWGDVYDCGFELANRGRFALDDVRFTYDVVRKVPETQSCAADCVLFAPLAAVPPGPKCPGEPFVLRADAPEQLDCPGLVYYSFAGPGVPPEAGWTTIPETTAVGEDGGYYALYAQCETQADCHDYRAFSNESPAAPAVGSILPGTLRARKSGPEVELSWLGAAAPASYGVWRASTRAELQAGLSAWTLIGRQDDAEGPRGEGTWRQDIASLGPGVTYLVVRGRDRCTDAPNP